MSNLSKSELIHTSFRNESSNIIQKKFATFTINNILITQIVVYRLLSLYTQDDSSRLYNMDQIRLCLFLFIIMSLKTIIRKQNSVSKNNIHSFLMRLRMFTIFKFSLNIEFDQLKMFEPCTIKLSSINLPRWFILQMYSVNQKNICFCILKCTISIYTHAKQYYILVKIYLKDSRIRNYRIVLKLIVC